MTRYFDTSALVKYFHKESGSDVVVSLIHEPTCKSCISELAGLEFKSALYRRFRNRELTAAQLDAALEKFLLAEKNFRVIPVDSLVISRAELILRKYGRDKGLRTLDAIHIATFLHNEEKSWRFVVSDRHLNSIAEAIGINTISVV